MAVSLLLMLGMGVKRGEASTALLLCNVKLRIKVSSQSCEYPVNVNYLINLMIPGAFKARCLVWVVQLAK